ncbi:AAA family ATPase [Lactobacillus acetotolerans]|uniref:AAA family ATPase n=2 Tax=Lactobacillus acetotolerans TaxID=1600 RepID=UPI002EDBAF2E
MLFCFIIYIIFLKVINMIIKRPRYIQFLKNFKDSEFIKVITGVRRSGKTYLMNMFIDELKKEGIPAKQIIYLNFESLQYSNFKDSMSLWHYVMDHIVKGKKIISFLMKFKTLKIGKKQLIAYELIWMRIFILRDQILIYFLVN